MKNTSKFIKKNSYILILIPLILSYLFLIYLYYNNGLTIIDNYIYNKLYFNKFIISSFKIITNFGSFITLFLLTITITLYYKNNKYHIYIFLNLILSYLINFAFKMMFLRSRPLDINIIKVTGYSFPSGHTTVSTAVYGLLIYLIYKSKISKKVKILFISLLGLLILLIGVSRIYLGVHFATDVIASYLLSVIYLVLFIKLTNKKTLHL